MWIERTKTVNGRKIFLIEQDISGLAETYSHEHHKANRAHVSNVRPETRIEPVSAQRYGCITHSSDAEALVAKGWAEGAERIDALRRTLRSTVKPPLSRKRRQIWSDDGETLDADRALAGQWDTAFRTTKRAMVRAPAMVSILVNWGGNWSVAAEQLFWQGAQAVVLSDILEDAGYRTRITAVGAVDSYRNVKASVIHVKDHGEPLRIDAVASIICHGGVYRCFGFAQTVLAPWDVGGSLGCHLDIAEARRILEDADEWPSDALAMSDAYDQDRAAENVARALAAIERGQEEAA